MKLKDFVNQKKNKRNKQISLDVRKKKLIECNLVIKDILNMEINMTTNILVWVSGRDKPVMVPVVDAQKDAEDIIKVIMTDNCGYLKLKHSLSKSSFIFRISEIQYVEIAPTT